MTDEKKTLNPEEEKKALIKRCVGIVVVGVIVLVAFNYMIGGITNLAMQDAYDAQSNAAQQELTD